MSQPSLCFCRLGSHPLHRCQTEGLALREHTAPTCGGFLPSLPRGFTCMEEGAAPSRWHTGALLPACAISASLAQRNA